MSNGAGAPVAALSADAIANPTSFDDDGLAPSRRLHDAWKRTFDVVIAGALVVLLAVPMAIVAIAIKIDSRGPVFFAQERYGYRGARFRMLKFRSMIVSAEAELPALLARNDAAAPLFKLREDPRRTRVGRFIRRFSIDELPQLFNVIAGRMSLVGPRPALPQEIEVLGPVMSARMLVKPGMTGLWQVSGRSLLPADEAASLDLRYVRETSWRLDLMILVRTVPAVLSGRGAC